MPRLVLLGLIALIGSLAGAAGADGSGSRPLLVVELPYVDAPPGTELTVAGRYVSWLGHRVVLADTDATFTLGDESLIRTLRDTQTREQTRAWRVVVERGTDGPSYSLVGVGDVVELEDLAAGILAEDGSAHLARRRAALAWLLGHLTGLADEGLVGNVRSSLFETLRRQVEEGATGSLGNLDWLDLGEALLGGDPRWVEYVTSFAGKHGDQPRLQRQLLELGYINQRGKWRREADFLAEIGMVRSGERRITLERHFLETTVELWRESDDDIKLLRSFTQDQYLDAARRGETRRGMSRRELVVAWGYPERVTWMRDGDHLYEGWFFEDGGQVYLVKGLVFRWSKD